MRKFGKCTQWIILTRLSSTAVAQVGLFYLKEKRPAASTQWRCNAREVLMDPSILTRSAREPASIFLMTRARWFSTVR